MTDHSEPTAEERAAITYLRSPLAIRARCENVLARGVGAGLDHFAIDLDQLDAAAAEVEAVTRAQYPTLAIPVHGRINHFRAGGVDRLATLSAQMDAAGRRPPTEKARALVDLVVVSVLLDAGAGPDWHFHEPATGQRIARSEGLAVASLHAFAAGLFSADKREPWRVDARALVELDADRLGAAFQVGPDNPLVGLDGRAQLMRQLGEALRGGSSWFPGHRPGSLIDSLGALSRDGQVAAAEVLGALLDGLADIWPGRVTLGGVNLGDVWRHPAAGGEGASAGLVPFHKLSQWLAYSLFEPLELAGLTVTQPGALTGLPEYRNGGLLLDAGVLAPRHDGVLRDAHAPGDEVIVEWRALTVALLDRVADAVRERLGKTAAELPLANILEGGTWAAGRKLAAERRGGAPPIRVVSDGTVF
jgi:hypothetical protein